MPLETSGVLGSLAGIRELFKGEKPAVKPEEQKK